MDPVRSRQESDWRSAEAGGGKPRRVVHREPNDTERNPRSRVLRVHHHWSIQELKHRMGRRGNVRLREWRRQPFDFAVSMIDDSSLFRMVRRVMPMDDIRVMNLARPTDVHVLWWQPCCRQQTACCQDSGRSSKRVELHRSGLLARGGPRVKPLVRRERTASVASGQSVIIVPYSVGSEHR